MTDRGGWIGVDLDGTLAHYEGWNNGRIGLPIDAMVARVKRWLREGRDVRILTARVSSSASPAERIAQRELIEQWTRTHIGQALPSTAEKDFGMVELWDDRAVRVQKNRGEPCCGVVYADAGRV